MIIAILMTGTHEFNDFGQNTKSVLGTTRHGFVAVRDEDTVTSHILELKIYLELTWRHRAWVPLVAACASGSHLYLPAVVPSPFWFSFQRFGDRNHV